MKKLSVFLSVFFFWLLVYLLSLSPSIGFGDGATFLSQAMDFKFEARSTSHPLYYFVCQIFQLIPFLDAAYKINLVSAISAAMTVAVLHILLRHAGVSLLPALFAGTAFGFSHTFWLKASLADHYTLQLLIVALSWYSLIRWDGSDKKKSLNWLCLWAFLWGMALMQHTLILFILPGELLFIFMKREKLDLKPSRILIPVIVFLAASSLWWSHYFLQVADGENPIAIWTGGGGVERKVLGYGLAELPREIVVFLLFLGYQFPWLESLLAVPGIFIITHRNPALNIMLSTAFLITVCFGINYKESHKYELFMQAYLAFAVWIAFGAEWLSTRIGWKISSILFAATLIFQPLATSNDTRKNFRSMLEISLTGRHSDIFSGLRKPMIIQH